jgi:acetyl-CoA acyltransferase
MKDAVIVAYGRSAVGKASKGMLRNTRPEDYAAQVLSGVLQQVPQLDPAEIDDIVIGCAFPEAEQGLNTGRNIGLRAGIPHTVPAQTVNRFCSSGLQSIAIAANSIMSGQAEVVLAGGVESMTMIPMGGNIVAPNPNLMEIYPEAYMSMGITAENVADRYSITRQEQDEFAYHSHMKAATAQASGKFNSQIIPVDAFQVISGKDGIPVVEKVVFDRDEGVRTNLTKEALQKLPAVFKKNGTVTPGNASQMSDGAAAILLMSAKKTAQLEIVPIARFVSYAVAGVAPAVMGIGPVEAVPKALKLAGIQAGNLDLIELNEAFASQSIACVRELKLDPDIVNVNGGAIAIGHPLGCTGTLLTAKLLAELSRRKRRYGMVSMCIGGGMGAAAIFESL